MKSSTAICWMALCLLSLPPTIVCSQTAPEHHPWWVSVGAGPSWTAGTLTMNAGMVYSYQFEQSTINARIIGLTNDNPTVQRFDRSAVVYKMADYGVLYGPIWKSGTGYFSAAAGIGLVRAEYGPVNQFTRSTSISLPLELQWFWRPTAFFGAGVYAYGSLNSGKQLAGIMLCAQLGMW